MYVNICINVNKKFEKKNILKAIDFASQHTNIEDMRKILSFTRNGQSYSTMANLGKRKTVKRDLILPWDRLMARNLAKLSWRTCYHNFSKNTVPNTFGLYRVDGLGILNETPQKIQKVKKGICMQDIQRKRSSSYY